MGNGSKLGGCVLRRLRGCVPQKRCSDAPAARTKAVHIWEASPVLPRSRPSFSIAT